MNRPGRRIGAAIITGVAVIATASCTGGGAASGSGDPNTITYLIGQPEDPAQLDLTKQDIAAFEKESGITVKLNVLPTDTLRTVLQTQLRSANGPDVFGYDTGPGFAGALAKAGLLYDLTDAYEQNDWTIYDWAKERVTFDGKVLGVPTQVEEIGIFYNADLFTQLGISPPQNLADLDAAAEKIKAAGKIPFSFSDKEGWEGGHLLSAPLSSAVGQKGMEDLLSGAMPWNSKPVVDAITLFFKTYNEKGYLPESPNAITYDNANSLFYSGQTAMNPTGTWMTSDIQSTAEFEVGFMPFPAPDGPGIFSGGLGSGTFVSAQAGNPEAAVKFVDYLNSPEHGTWQVEELRTIPAYPVDTAGIQADPLFQQILTDTGNIATGQGEFGYNIDVLTPDTFNKAMWDGLQGVLTGQKTPQEVADELQAAFKESGAGED